jgi:hypothetical protein
VPGGLCQITPWLLNVVAAKNYQARTRESLMAWHGHGDQIPSWETALKQNGSDADGIHHYCDKITMARDLRLINICCSLVDSTVAAACFHSFVSRVGCLDGQAS